MPLAVLSLDDAVTAFQLQDTAELHLNSLWFFKKNLKHICLAIKLCLI